MLFDELMAKKMTAQESAWFDSMRASRRNDIAFAVTRKLSKEEFAPKTQAEEWYFDHLSEVAKAHLEKYGDWPVYEMEEIDWDDPILDIYSTSAKEYSEDRRKRGLVNPPGKKPEETL